jgi:anti-sigma B factor antagonist
MPAMFGTFELQHEEHGRRSDLRVVGDLDIATAPQLRRVVGDVMGTGVRDVRVDMTRAEFIDSSGLGALLWADHRLRAVGGQLSVVNAHDGVLRSFELAGLDDMLLH